MFRTDPTDCDIPLFVISTSGNLNQVFVIPKLLGRLKINAVFRKIRLALARIIFEIHILIIPFRRLRQAWLLCATQSAQGRGLHRSGDLAAYAVAYDTGGTLQDVRVETREDTYTFRGEDVTASHEFYVCSVCSEEFATATQADESFRAVREEYRGRHDLVTPGVDRANTAREDRCRPAYKARLLKLAFLADQHHFRAHTVSLTVRPYARLDHGPVPQDYKEMLVAAEEDGFVASIDEVIRRWGTLSAAELSQFTYTLPACQMTSHASEISYAWTLEEAWPE